MSLFNNAIIGAAGQQGYKISRSVRLRSSASAYFSRTFGTPTSQNTWTLSFWVKRGVLSSSIEPFSAGGANRMEFIFAANNTFQLADASTTFIATTSVYRDPSAWYHIVVRANGSGSAMQVYVNGVLTTNSTTNNLTTSYWNSSGTTHYIGALGGFSSNYFDGYLTEINFVDGQSLAPTSFGQFNSITGVWQPLKYTGTYGTNGFYLNFSDNSSNTATTIGKDYSGNGNNWTPNNISVTAGTTYDSMLDVPTLFADGGNGRGNYPVLNPLDVTATTKPTNGNLTYSPSATSPQVAISTIDIPSIGKWYAEFTKSDSASTSWPAGIIGTGRTDTYVGGTNSIGYWASGQIYKDTSLVQSSLATLASGDVVGVAVDADAKTVQFYKNGSTVGTAVSYTYSQVWFACGNFVSGLVFNANFGQRPFTYTPPSGYVALNTQNLPDSAIKAGNKYFDATTYTGTGASQSIVNGGFQPDLAWFKVRNTTYSHTLLDALRNSGANALFTDSTAAESVNYANGQITAFNANGVIINGGVAINESTRPYVAWQWKKGATQGFDIVTYTGTGVARTVAHSLGAAPKMMIVKTRSAISAWVAYHASLGTGKVMILNGTNAVQSLANYWDTAPDSSVINLGSNSDVNANGSTFVAYLFSEVAGFSKIGSYTGNGSTDGPFVYLGFRPRWIMLKSSTSIQDWKILDTSRNTYNSTNSLLGANISSAEDTNVVYDFDILSNGFKIRNTFGYGNTSGQTYVYAAFAENPFRLSLAR